MLRISGLFKDAFPQLVSWVNQAQQMVALLEEPEEINLWPASPVVVALGRAMDPRRLWRWVAG